MIRNAVAIALGVCALNAMAQMTPVGLWKTIDDNDGSAKSEIRIVDKGGVINGKIEKMLTPNADPNETCKMCEGDRKDAPVTGLELMRGLKKSETRDNLWDGGTIVEPSTGKVYKVQLMPIEGGKKMEVRGYVGAPLFGRTQTWVRVQ